MEQFTKAVQIISFSIGDVPGFTALSTVGTQPMKRMLSAINTILNTLHSHRDQVYGRGSHDAEFRIFVEKIAIANILLKDRLETKFNDILVVNGIKELTSEELIAHDNSQIYKNNFACFRENFTEIKDFITSRKDIVRTNAQTIKTDPKENIPILFLCKGNVFGEKPFPVYMTMSDAKEVGYDYKLAVKHFCYAVLSSRKNYFISQLGMGDTEFTLKNNHNILKIDEFIGTIDFIDIEEIGPVLSYCSMVSIPLKSTEYISKVTDTLMIEAERRLYEYLEAMFN